MSILKQVYTYTNISTAIAFRVINDTPKDIVITNLRARLAIEELNCQSNR